MRWTQLVDLGVMTGALVVVLAVLVRALTRRG
jgi:hypothetical protein